MGGKKKKRGRQVPAPSLNEIISSGLAAAALPSLEYPFLRPPTNQWTRQDRAM